MVRTNVPNALLKSNIVSMQMGSAKNVRDRNVIMKLRAIGTQTWMATLYARNVMRNVLMGKLFQRSVNVNSIDSGLWEMVGNVYALIAYLDKVKSNR